MICTGTSIRDQGPERPFTATQTGRQFPNALPDASPAFLQSNSFYTNKSVVLFNGDTCLVGQWVLIRNGAGGAPRVVRIEEILNQIGTSNSRWSRPDAILVQCGSINGYAQASHMPMVAIDNNLLLLPIHVRSRRLFVMYIL